MPPQGFERNKASSEYTMHFEKNYPTWHAETLSDELPKNQGSCTSMMLKVLFFFLHRRSHRRANMTKCLLFYLFNTAVRGRLRCARASMIGGFPILFPVM